MKGLTSRWISGAVDRRRFLSTTLGACAISPPFRFLAYAACGQYECVFDKRTT